MYVCVPECMYVDLRQEPKGGQKRVLKAVKLELQDAVSHVIFGN